ncbi:hypothetical protein [Arthrobacter methylotrophus]|uniref:hypothetical protein n=1 Tax=Arthrobacter methylotrophus TaxID=121291 RepID=UPI0031EFBA6C
MPRISAGTAHGQYSDPDVLANPDSPASWHRPRPAWQEKNGQDQEVIEVCRRKGSGCCQYGAAQIFHCC